MEIDYYAGCNSLLFKRISGIYFGPKIRERGVLYG